MNGPLPPHLAYLASAGSGKTYRLAHRIIHLLTLGVEASAICALTFSRKAAGEIFESVAGYLIQAAESEAAAARTAAALGRPGLGREAFRDALRAFLDGMHRTCIGTIDSFIHSVARAFACELGIASSFQAADSDSAEAREMLRATLERLLAEDAAAGAGGGELAAAFREAKCGRESKRFLYGLGRLVTTWQPVYQALPEPERWTEHAVWPGGIPIPLPDTDQLEAACRRLSEWAEEQPDSDKLVKAVEPLLAEVWRFEAGNDWPRSTPFKNACAAYSELLAGDAEFNVAAKKRRCNGELAAAWVTLIHRVTALELQRRVRATGGLRRLTALYERAYQEQIRLTGRMTFSDLTRLLAPGPDGRGLTGNPGAPDRLFIDYRLDARIRHWLLDEFQDTSDLQWAVLGNLVDEAMQDAEDERRFFCVGDVKQAIYGWRGGNARIFEGLRHRYGDALRFEPLPQSFRSAPVVIEAVNRLFSDLDFGDGIPAAVRQRWGALWDEHTFADKNRGLNGCVAVVESPPPETRASSRASALAAVLPALAETLREINPPARGLSAAILLRGNESAKEVVEYLREHLPRVPVRLEGESDLLDCPAVRVLLAALRESFHPLDGVAAGVVRMSPLGSVPSHAPGSVPGTRAPSPGTIRADFCSRGALAAMTRLRDALAAAAPPDAFARRRLRTLMDLAAAFDAAGGGTPDQFDTLVREHTFGDRAAAEAVRVMTIHKSKGLGFDLVLLPGLGTARFLPSAAKSGPLEDAAHTPPAWVIEKPLGGACALDPTLTAALAANRDEEAFEEVCLFYVAVTRAKQGVYLYTTTPAEKKGRKDAPAATDQGAYVLEKLPRAGSEDLSVGPGRVTRLMGDWDWYQGATSAASEIVLPPPALPASFAAAGSPALAPVAPSAVADFVQSADRVFDPESYRVLAFGSHMHDLFQRVQWIGDADPGALLQAWRAEARPDDRMDAHITPQFRACFDRPDFRRELSRPAGDAVVWREKRFELVTGDQWVSGTFDRVVLSRDAEGKVASITVLDYKTDRVTDPSAIARQAAHHAAQMNAYRAALARMFALDPARIRAVLLFTVPGQAVEVPP